MLAATVLALGSAVVHAAWNLLIKTSEDRAIAAWGQFGAAGAVAGLALLVVGPPGADALPYLAASGAVHVVYVEALIAAYERGDFSLSYPLARGGGAVLAALGGAALLGDRLPLVGWLGIAVAGAGLIGLRGRGVPVAEDVVLGDVRSDVPPPAPASGHDEQAAVGFALLTACCIAAYTLADSAGARVVDDGVSYGLASVAAAGLTVSAANLVRRSRRSRAKVLRSDWHRHLAGGLGTLVAYTMVLVAVRSAPVGHVTMLRESSVVLGAGAGWLLLGEGMAARRVTMSLLVLVGLVTLVASGG